jgi:SAM-dependent methyltransferase
VEASLSRVRATIGEREVAGYRFFDFGSGKGKVLIQARRLLGIPAVGIEYNPELVKVARRNLGICGIEDAEFVVSDAAEFTDFGPRVICFAYNPFDAEVLAPVLRNLEAPDDVLFVYNNPVHADLFAGWHIVHDQPAQHPNCCYKFFRRQSVARSTEPRTVGARLQPNGDSH